MYYDPGCLIENMAYIPIASLKIIGLFIENRRGSNLEQELGMPTQLAWIDENEPHVSECYDCLYSKSLGDKYILCKNDFRVLNIAKKSNYDVIFDPDSNSLDSGIEFF